MITIQSQGISYEGKTKYVIRVGNVFIAEFWHKRTDGLGRRLLEASKAVENMMRYQKTLAEIYSNDYLFSFNHDSFEIFADELAGVLKQFTRVK